MFRRFRDYGLAENPFGRAFIKTYLHHQPDPGEVVRRHILVQEDVARQPGQARCQMPGERVC